MKGFEDAILARDKQVVHIADYMFAGHEWQLNIQRRPRSGVLYIPDPRKNKARRLAIISSLVIALCLPSSDLDCDWR